MKKYSYVFGIIFLPFFASAGNGLSCCKSDDVDQKYRFNEKGIYDAALSWMLTNREESGLLPGRQRGSGSSSSYSSDSSDQEDGKIRRIKVVMSPVLDNGEKSETSYVWILTNNERLLWQQHRELELKLKEYKEELAEHHVLPLSTRLHYEIYHGVDERSFKPVYTNQINFTLKD